jgi:hypothetical protein
LQEFATGVKQLAHQAYTAPPKDNVRRQADKAFADGVDVEDPAIKIQMLLGGEETVNKAIRHALKLLAVRAQKNECQDILGGAESPQPGKKTNENWRAGAVESQSTCGVTGLTGGRQKTMTSVGNEKKDLQNTRELARRSKWRLRNNREPDRGGSQPSGNEWVLVVKGERLHVH